jgi:hypothetical protein
MVDHGAATCVPYGLPLFGGAVELSQADCEAGFWQKSLVQGFHGSLVPEARNAMCIATFWVVVAMTPMRCAWRVMQA